MAIKKPPEKWLNFFNFENNGISHKKVSIEQWFLISSDRLPFSGILENEITLLCQFA